MSKYFLVPLVFAGGLISGCYFGPYCLYPSQDINYQIEVCFTPSMQCLPLIEQTLQEAYESIYVHSYSLTSKSIAQHLVNAHKKGIHVEIIADSGQSKSRYSQIDFLKSSGIPIWIDESIPGYHHNKIMIIDKKTVICGSYNFSDAAENRNAENLLIINSPKIAHQYLENWKENLSRIHHKLNKKTKELDDLKLSYNDLEDELIHKTQEGEVQKEKFQKIYFNLNSAVVALRVEKDDAFKQTKNLKIQQEMSEKELNSWKTAIKVIHDQTVILLQKRSTYADELDQFLKPIIYPSRMSSSSPKKGLLEDMFKRSSNKIKEIELEPLTHQNEGFSPKQKINIKNFISTINNEIYQELTYIHRICVNKLSYIDEFI